MTDPKDAPSHGATIAAVAYGEKTWGEVFDVTRLEAYGIAALAQQFLDVGQMEKARNIVEGLTALNPNDGYFPALLGAICGRMGDDDKALEHYSRAIELDPQNLAALVSRADLYLQRGLIEPALVDLTAAVRCDPQGKTNLGERAIALARATADGMRAFVAEAAAKPRKAPPPATKSAPSSAPAAAAPAAAPPAAAPPAAAAPAASGGPPRRPVKKKVKKKVIGKRIGRS